ncbi:MAG: hypothetical protein ACR2H3_08795, partial [Acidimicrobiales bacterium]
ASVDELGELPDEDAERGRGLFLVRALVDDMCIDTADGITTVTVARRAIIAGLADQRVNLPPTVSANGQPVAPRPGRLA